MAQYEIVVGLEVHVQLNTKTKIFCSCSTLFGQGPNTQVCPVCLGLPGTLPVFNRKVMESGILASLALGCRIGERQKFDRKNYFYPDLPKAYQTSQLDQPVGIAGKLDFICEGEHKTVQINRIHMEEDAGKLVHDIRTDGSSGVDYNRCGVPLLEIVTEPDISSAQEAFDYLTQLKRTLLYLGISDCNMEEGSLRCDANISLRPKGETKLGTKTEVKNMNSFRGVLKAIEYEAARQEKLLNKGERIVQETRLWNADREVTFSMRSKEEAHDYRYFPEPDLLPFEVTADEVEEIKKNLPEIPFERMLRFEKDFSIPRYDADVLCADLDVAEYFEKCATICEDAKSASNWIMVEMMRRLNDAEIGINDSKITPEMLADMIKLINSGTINGKTAKQVFAEMFESGKAAKTIVEEKGLVQISDTAELEKIVRGIVEANPGPVNDVRSGKNQAIGFLVGQVMKQTRGKANPPMVNELLRKIIAE